MVTKEQILKDDRFFVDEFNLNRFSKGEIKKYKIVTIPIKKILMLMDTGIISLYETDVYKYLNNTYETERNYKDYCSRYGTNNPNRNLDNYNKLIENMSSDEYDLKKGAIFVDQFNILLDGQHRSCILLKKYGPDYKINVVKIYFKGVHIFKRRLLLKRRLKK